MPRPRIPRTSRAEWLAARAGLASRRLRPLVPLWIIVFALLFAAVYAVRGPLAWRAASTQRAVTRAQAAERDTLPLIDRLQTAQARLNRDDSALQVLFAAMEAHRAARILSVALQHERDSLQAVVGQLDGALDRASKAPLSASYRALATTPALGALGSAQMLVDTLDLLEETRRALDPVAAPQREFALISERANAIGRTLQEIGQSRRAALIQQIAAIDSQATATQGPARVTADTADFRMRRDGARLEVSRADSSLRDARQWHA